MSHQKAHKAHKEVNERLALNNHFVLFVPFCGEN
jgi:hypothetical protein